MNIAQQIVTTDTTARKSVSVFGDIQIVYLAVSEETQGAFSLFELTFAPGLGPPTHIHSREDESFYVLEGRFRIEIGDQSFSAGPGWFGIGPRDVPHRLTAEGTTLAKMLIAVSPGGFESFFDDLAEVSARPPFDSERIREAFERHGMRLVGSQ